MNPRLRKFIGTVLLLSFSAVYFAIVLAFAIPRPDTTSLGAELLYYLIATIIWMVPAGLILRWMQGSGGRKPAPASP
jgi:hypothetical protein